MTTVDTSRYDDAIAALYSPLHQARTQEALKQAASRRTNTIADMHEYMRRIGLLASEILPTNIIHITGTKGKGSTACMCEAILRERYNLNTGLFTSPHLVDIRERIRVNGKPISQQVFAQAYWQIRERLEEYENQRDDLPTLPGYFRIMTLMALHVFSHYQPQLDVIILEVGMGGRYDATNVLDFDKRNVVYGITLLDLDHTRVLGDTIAQIAWEKGGIFQRKKGAAETSKRPTASADDDVDVSTSNADASKDATKRFFALDTNTDAGIAVLRNCAAVEAQGLVLHLVSEGQSLPADLELGLQGDHQRINAELAVCLCEALVAGMGRVEDGGTQAMHRALENVSWPGRCQSVTLAADDGTPLNLYLDGAHTPKALEACLKWYSSVGDTTHNVHTVLIFNCSHERNPVELLQQLTSCRPSFDTVYFCRADFERPSMVGKPTARELLESNDGIDNVGKDTESAEANTWQETLAHVWKYFETTVSTTSPAAITSTLNVGDAIHHIQQIAGFEQIEVLATGSLYIVGSALDAVEWKEDVAKGSLRVEET